jgi:antitoxin component of MazEF toxin-antitoxin module
MSITTTQKVIKVGDSLAVTIPAKDARRLSVKKGDQLNVSFEKATDSVEQKAEIVELTQKLIARHEKALKNLSQR